MAKLYKITFADGMAKEMADKKIALGYIRKYIEECSGMSDEELLHHNFSYKIEELERPLTKLSYDDLVKSGCVAREFLPIDKKNMSAIKAIYQLFTLARAWNEEDGFVPDFSDRNQNKWFPYIRRADNQIGLTCSGVGNKGMSSVNIGSLFRFKTAERAKQFGEQFEDLFDMIFGIEQ